MHKTLARPIASAVLLMCFACQSSRASSRPEEIAPEKVSTSRPVVSAVELEDTLRGAFKPVMSVQELDRAVRDELERRVEQPMAGSGEPYQATDVVLDDLPWRRFVVAGVSTLSPKFWVLCYEHGGMGHHHHLALFSIEDGLASVLKAGSWLPGRARPVTLESAVEALRNDQQRRGDHW